MYLMYKYYRGIGGMGQNRLGRHKKGYRAFRAATTNPTGSHPVNCKNKNAFKNIKTVIKQKPPLNKDGFVCGDPDGIRTRVTAVKGRCLRPLDHRAGWWL